jgi:hypothetical protein
MRRLFTISRYLLTEAFLAFVNRYLINVTEKLNQTLTHEFK